MLKLKLIAILGIFVLVGIVLSSSSTFSASAENDIAVQEIAGYKTWTKINKEPIIATNQIDGSVSEKSVFIVDGQEVVNFRTGQLNG